MDNKLTKTALKNELVRRIEWLEKSYKFNHESNEDNTETILHKQLGIYYTYLTILDQIKNNRFIGGYV